MEIQKYEAARNMLPNYADKYILNKEIIPWFVCDGEFIYKKEYWINEEKSFAYKWVNTINKTEIELFNYEFISKKLSTYLGSELKKENINLTNFRINNNNLIFFFENNEYYYNLLSKQFLQSKVKIMPGENMSPNGKKTVFYRDYNLYLRDLETNDIKQITFDGCLHYDYGNRLEEDTSYISDEISGNLTTTLVFWSPNSKKFATYKVDQRNIKELNLLKCVSDTGEFERPEIFRYKYPLPGDDIVAKAEIYIYDLEYESLIKWSYGSFDMGVFIYFPTLEGYKFISWSIDSNKFAVRLISRNHKEGKLVQVIAETGESEVLDKESSDTFIFSTWYTLLNGMIYTPMTSSNTGYYSYYSHNGNKVYFISERDGFNHIYEINTENNNKIRQITKGNWQVGQILFIDENKIYFTGLAADKNINPYYQQLYKVDIYSMCVCKLTPENANHIINIDPDGNYFVDYFDTVSKVPEVIIRDMNGKLCMNLLKSDSKKLCDRGFSIPIEFKFKSYDMITDIYGIIILPSNFDKNNKYPLVEYCYGGPQVCNVPVHYYGTLDAGFVQSLAQLGFITIIIDGRGTPFRGKRFHDYAYKNLGDCAGISDHISVIKQLCERYPFIDREHIGIWGHSGGGYAAYKYIVEYGDVYKVAVSSSGNHFQELYVASWSEGFMNDYDKDLWIKQGMKGKASKFNGKLLLIHGDMDDNVHIANTMYIVDELVKENKDFDLIIIPNGNHILKDNPYYQRRILDYFVKNLMGEDPPNGFNMKLI